MKKHELNIQTKKVGSGLVFGKFMPLHEGHIHLLKFARKSCHRLTILVCSLPNEPIPGQIRYLWMKELFPDANVVHHDAVIPQEPSEHPDFWNIWKESIAKHCPGEEFDAIFGSEDYGWKMAKTMGIEYIPVNRLRDIVPVSGTLIRQDPMKYWEYIPRVARPYFVKKVCIVGPESTGKSRLTKDLAEKYNTVYVDEYARRLLDEYVQNLHYQDGQVLYGDISTIARGQIVTEDAQAERANKILFCDTDLITTVYWSHFYFKKCPRWIRDEAYRRQYDLYLLLDIDVPWIQDPQRPMPDEGERRGFFDWWEQELKARQRPYAVIRGNWQERFDSACREVDKILRPPTPGD